MVELSVLEHTSSVQSPYSGLTTVNHVPTFHNDVIKLIQICFATIHQWLPWVNVQRSPVSSVEKKECPVEFIPGIQ